MLSRLKRGGRTVGIGLAGLGIIAVVALVGLAVLQAPPVRARVLASLISRLERAGIVVSAARLDYNLLTLDVRLQGVTLATVATPARPFFTAEEARLVLGWGTLQGRIDLARVELVRPRVALQRDGTTVNWPAPSRQPPSSASRTSVRLRQLHIRDLGVEWRDTSTASSAEAAGLSIDLFPTAGGPAGVLHMTGPTRMRWRDRDVTISGLDGQLSWNDRDLSVSALRVVLPQGALQIDGRADALLDAPRVDLRLTTDLDLAAIAREMRLRRELAGMLHADAFVKGLASAPDVELTTLTARVAGGWLTGRGRMSIGEGPGVLRLDWRQLDLMTLVHAFGGAASVQLAARLDGSLRASWVAPRLEALLVHVEARTLGDERSHALPLDGSSVGDLRGRRWTLRAGPSISDSIRAVADLNGVLDPQDLSRSAVGGAVDVSAPDVARLAGTLARAGVGGLPSEIGGAADGHFMVTGTLGAPRLTGSIEAVNVRYKPLSPATLRARLSATLSDIQLSAIEGRLGESSVRGDARLSIASGPPKGKLGGKLGGKLEGTLDGKLEASLNGADLSPLVPSIVHPQGSVALVVNLAGSTASPHVTATVTGADLAAAGQRVDAFEASVAITGRTITSDRVRLQSGDGRLDATGSIDWTQRRFALHAGADHLPIRPVPDAAGAVMVPIATRLTGQIEGEGTFSSLNAHGTLSLAETRWSNADFGPIDARVSAAGHTVSVEMRAPDLALTATGDIDVDSRGPVSVHGRWEPNDLAALSRRLGWNPPFPLGGTAAFGFDVAGTRDRPRDLHGAVDLDRLNVDVDRQSVRLAQPARVEYDGSALRARDVRLTTGGSTLTVTGSLGDPASRGLAIAFDGLLADIASIARVVGPTTFLSEHLTGQRSPTGALAIRLDATGPVGQPILSGSLQLTDGRLPITAESAVTGIGLAARYDSGVLLVDGLRAAFQGATVEASGRVPTHLFLDRLPVRWRDLVAQTSGPAGGPAEMNARLASVTPQVAAPFVDGSTLEPVGGQIDASVQLQADRAALDHLQGTVTLSRAELSLSGVPLDQQKPTRLIFHEGRLDIADWEWGLGDNRVTLNGGMALGGDRNIDIRAGATLDLRLINAFTRVARTTGRADSTVRVGGTVAAPTLDGYVTISAGDLRLASPRIVLSDLTGTITLARDTLTLEQLSSSLNGGQTEIAGTIHHRWLRPLDGQVTLHGRGTALDLVGLRAETDTDLTFSLEPSGSLVSGTVTLVRSAYREPLSLTGGLLRALQTSSSYGQAGSGSSLDALDNIRLDVHVVTQDDLLVDNNYARLAASSDVRIVGTLNQPALIGRATVSEGGLIYFGGNRYALDGQGSIDFVNPTRVEPDLNLKAVTHVAAAGADVDITLTLKGTPSTLQSPLLSSVSHPEYSQSDLVSLLVTGQTAANAAAGGFAPGSEELLGYLSGELFGAAGRAVGLDVLRVERGTPDVRYDAGLVATETDPSARLTFGKNIGRNAQVVFSQSLQQSGGLTWIVSYAPRSNIELRAVSLDAGTRRYDLRHDLVFGAPTARRPRAPAPEQPRVSSVRIVLHLEPNAALLGAGPDEAALRTRLEIKAGDRFSFFRWQDDRDRLESFYHERDRLEARVTTCRIASEASADRAGTVDLTYDLRPGPRTTIAIEGFSFPRSVIAAMRTEWTHAIVDDFFAEGAASIARGELADRGFVRASVVARIDHPAPDEKRLRLTVDPGQHTERRVVIQGNRDIPGDRLRALIGNRELARAVWLEPDRVRETLVHFYRGEGYLNASVQVDPIAIDGSIATRTVVVQERERFRVREIGVEGARALSPDEVRTLSALSNADFSEDAIDRARRAIDASYRARGFNNVGLTLRTEAIAGRAEVNVAIKVEEGPEQRLADIVTAGVVRTSPGLVSRALRLEMGKPVNLAEWYQARRRLFETGVFRSVDIEPETLPGTSGTPGTPGTAGNPPQQPIRARVTLEEWPPLRLRYGLEVNDEERTPSAAASALALEPASPSGRTFGVGVSSDLSARSLFGHGVSAGVAGGYRRDFRAARVYMTSPSMFGLPITSNVFVSRSREQRGQAADLSSQFVTDTIDLTLEQRVRPSGKMEVSYRYTFGRNHTFESHPRPGDLFPFDATVNVARLASTILVDTRDDLVDATRGSFHSSDLEFGPSSLGSEAQFVKYLLQQRYYYAVHGVVLATSARVGLAAGLHHELLIPIERFFAGGGNSVRGYAEDALTPRDDLGNAVGGGALLVLNEEVRFPIVKLVRGVGFLDLGRAFNTVKDLRLGDLSAGAGIGLRVRTPIVLLRVDFGVPLDSSFGPRRGRLFFSIGQAF